MGDRISLREKSRTFKVNQEALGEVQPNVPEYLPYDEQTHDRRIPVRLPRRDELNPDIRESEIVEFYSRVNLQAMEHSIACFLHKKKETDLPSGLVVDI